jgi:tetratricopeptide (TPR) repeat protein
MLNTRHLRLALLLPLLNPAPASPLLAFQVDSPSAESVGNQRNPLELLEAGRATSATVSKSIVALADRRYEDALASVSDADLRWAPWFKDYLAGLVKVTAPLEKSESDHFILYTPPGQAFLKDYALPTLERAGSYMEKNFGHRPDRKIVVEIYPTEADFSAASTLSEETLERSGAIGICKFHRLMIMTPRALPLGYRWLDALSHEYTHLMINELSDAKAELWLHEGTARYFETAYRANPPIFLAPVQQTALLEAIDKGTLVPFAKMSPSMVYLKDQEQVSLAFAEVSHAVSLLVARHGIPTFVGFLTELKKQPFPKAFRAKFGKDPDAFEKEWQAALAKEPWPRVKGAMSETVRFQALDESAEIGADAQAQTRFGDRMRVRGLYEAALIEYQKALAAEPDNAVVLLKVARTHLAMGEKDAALEPLRKATKSNPNYITPHVELALLADPAEALPHLEEAIALNPFDPRVHTRLAEIYDVQGKTADAQKERAILESLKD